MYLLYEQQIYLLKRSSTNAPLFSINISIMDIYDQKIKNWLLTERKKQKNHLYLYLTRDNGKANGYLSCRVCLMNG